MLKKTALFSRDGFPNSYSKMNKKLKYKDKDEFKDNDKDKDTKKITESLTVWGHHRHHPKKIFTQKNFTPKIGQITQG